MTKNMKDINALHKKAFLSLNNGDVDSALVLAEKIYNINVKGYSPLFACEIIMSVGDKKNDQDLIQKGIESLNSNLNEIVKDNEIAPYAFYTLANGHYSLFRLKRIKNATYYFFEDSELALAKRNFLNVLNYQISDLGHVSKTYVNLGNCYDHLGRGIDALECYEKAQTLDPQNSMAPGNKGIAMFNYAWLAGQHQGTFLGTAYSLLTQALKGDVEKEARRTFEHYLEAVKSKFEAKSKLNEAINYPGFKINAKSDLEQFLTEFCVKEKLYLNICNFCQKCDAAIGDMIGIQKMVTSIDNLNMNEIEKTPYYRLSSHLNQIKQDYVGARFLLTMSQYRKIDLKFVDKRVKIVNTLDYSTHNIYVQLLKFAFKCFYDILDKIACFINEYLSLGIPEKKIDFHWLWFADKDKTVTPAIKKTNNLSLNALFDIHRDFDFGNGQYAGLQKIRNALTHRFVNVRMMGGEINDENMSEHVLVDSTIRLCKIVRNAIIYVINSVYLEESKKEKKGNLPSISSDDIPDYLKYI